MKLEIIRRVQGHEDLTARPTSRAGTKVGLSDPVVPHGRAIAQRIKATPGITGLSPPRVHIDGEVWHLDVGYIASWGCSRSQGLGCSPIKAVRELGSERRETVRSLSVVGVGKFERSCPWYERTGMDASLVYQLFCQGHSWVAMCGRDKC